MFTLIFILFLLLLLGAVFGAFFLKIVSQSIKKEGDLGINLSKLTCPQCGKKTTLVRPTTLKNIPWGGGLCYFCGFQMDKWGIEFKTPDDEEKVVKQLENNQIIPATNFSHSDKTPLEKVFEENE